MVDGYIIKVRMILWGYVMVCQGRSQVIISGVKKTEKCKN